MGEPAVVVDHVKKQFRIYHERNQYLKASLLRGRRAKYEEFWAVDDVSFEIEKGETFGIIGHNGSGKSTLLKCLAKILTPEHGSVAVTGTMSALLELGAGFHPELSGRENVYLNAAILGLPRKQVDKKFDEIVDFSGLERFIDTPVKNYSSGMFVRLGFAVAINVDPEVLLIDEVLAVGDAAFQRKSAEKIADFRQDGRTIVIVSHDLSALRHLCDRLAWIDHGQLKKLGKAAELVDEYSGSAQADREVVAERPDGTESVRWGSGEARLTGFEIVDADGNPTSRVISGSPVRFRIRFESRDRVPTPVVGFAVTQLEGVLVHGVNNARHGRNLDYIDGPGLVDFVIPSLPLLEGIYNVTLAITDGSEMHQIDHWQNAFRFDVVRGPILEEGIVTFGGKWDISGARKSGG